ncbi:hypothetical protein LEMLEM_LOCUS18134, partial [Lemmus lemmus]
SPQKNGRKNIPSYNLEVSENSDSEVIYEQIEPICSSSCSKSLEDNLQWHSPGISLRWPPTRHHILTESLLHFSCRPEPAWISFNEVRNRTSPAPSFSVCYTCANLQGSNLCCCQLGRISLFH